MGRTLGGIAWRLWSVERRQKPAWRREQGAKSVLTSGPAPRPVPGAQMDVGRLPNCDGEAGNGCRLPRINLHFLAGVGKLPGVAIAPCQCASAWPPCATKRRLNCPSSFSSRAAPRTLRLPCPPPRQRCAIHSSGDRWKQLGQRCSCRSPPRTFPSPQPQPQASSGAHAPIPPPPRPAFTRPGPLTHRRHRRLQPRSARVLPVRVCSREFLPAPPAAVALQPWRSLWAVRSLPAPCRAAPLREVRGWGRDRVPAMPTRRMRALVRW